MTTVVINAISVREGGSLVVLRELLAGMVALRPQWRWQVVVNSVVPAMLTGLPNVEYLRFPNVDRSGLRTRIWYETGLPALLERVNASLLFSMTNYLPLRRVPCPTLLLVQHAGHFSPVFRKLTEERLSLQGRLAWRLKEHWVRASVRRADATTVQTAALAQRIAHDTGVPHSRIQVIPHGAGQALLQCQPVVSPLPGEKFRIGYITKFGVQKNFLVLMEAAARLKSMGMRLTLVFTLAETEAENRGVLEQAGQLGLGDDIENHGELSADEIGPLYQSLHAFVFPSLCESFGFPMVEAMAHGIPLLVADVDSNIEVAGTGGVGFPAHDAEALAGAIERLIRNGGWFRQRAQASLSRGREFEWGQAAARTVFLIEELISKKAAEA